MTDIDRKQKSNLTAEQKRERLKQLLKAESEKARTYPASFGQERLWYFQQLTPHSPAYNEFGAVRVHGPVQLDLLDTVFADLIARHETLRTTFAEVDGIPVQCVHAYPSETLRVVDLSHHSLEEQQTEFDRLLDAQINTPFDLDSGPLYRSMVTKFAAEEYALSMAFHHIVGDGWSIGVAMQEVLQRYLDLKRGQTGPQPKLKLQYRDFARWQRENVAGENYSRQFGWWKRRLRRLPDLELPTDRQRPSAPTFAGATHRFRLRKFVVDGLGGLAKSEGATLYMVVLAAFQLLLSRYASQKDFAIGSPVSGRHRANTETLIGFFVDMLVMRTSLEGNPGFRELLHRVRDNAIAAYSNQDVPFPKLVDAMQPQRHLNRQPLFQVVFVLNRDWSETMTEMFSLPGFQLDMLDIDPITAKYDLSLNLLESNQGVKGCFEYSTDLFDEATIDRLRRNFEVLLESIIANPDQPIDQLSLLTDIERRKTLVDWNDTATPLPDAACIHQLFEQQVRVNPDQVAVQFDGKYLSYRRLNERANQLARYLHQRGVGQETMVGICVDRSPELIVGLMAILKAGGAYVPLDPEYPRDRLSFMLADTRAPVLITETQFSDALPEFDGSIILIDQDAAAIGSLETDDLSCQSTGENLAYVIYTSGSTGRPKGVLVEHRNVCNLVTAHRSRFDLGIEDRVLQFASVSFDAAVWEIFPTLCSGATVCVAGKQQLIPGPELANTLKSQGITFATLPPTSLAATASEHFPELHTLVSAGDRCQSDIVATWGGGRKIINGYGPTETTVSATLGDCSSATRHPPIGRPIANTQVYVLDENRQPVPIGAPGELYVGGKSVARGYLNQPELTRDRFVPDPYGGDPDGRLYQTGDQVRWLADGNLEYLGRLDTQVKIRGFRIEPGEIESVLRETEPIEDAVVIPYDDVDRGKRLVAYVVPSRNANRVTDFSSTQLRGYLQGRIPDFMIPATFVRIDSLPLSPNGKVDHRRLPSPDASRPALEVDFVAPRNEIEQRLGSIYCDVLKLNQVGVHDSFFELGGDSILATQVVARIRTVFQIEIALRSLFEDPTIAQLARLISSGQCRPILPPIETVLRDGQLPLSYAQQRLWFLDQLQPNHPFYNVPGAVRVKGNLNIDALQGSIQQIVNRHEALRTTFETVDGQPWQRIAETMELDFPTTDLSGEPLENRETRIRELVIAEAQRPFDLSSGPLIRIKLYRLRHDEHVIQLTMHHIVSDGWSLGVMLRELSVLYPALSRSRRADLRKLKIQYADYAVWQRGWLTGDVLSQQLTWWKNQLHDVPRTLQFPADRLRPAIQSYRGSQQSHHLSSDLLSQLRNLGQAHDATLFMVMMAAWQILMGRYSDQSRVAVGTPVAGRGQTELEELIGFFVNTLVIAGDFSDNPSFPDFLADIREKTLGAFSHQDVPFEQVVEHINPPRDLSRSPLFQVSFALQNAPLPEERLPDDVTLEQLEVDSRICRFDLELHAWEQDGEIRLNLIYSSDLFDRETIVRLLSQYEQLLTAIVDEPERRINHYSLLAPGGQRQVIVDWNETDAEIPDQLGVHELFERQAELSPDAIAIRFEDQQLTYAQLNEQANQLARQLENRGVGREVLVGICLDRSPDLITAVLAILKAGGAFVPLDPEYPHERLDLMLADCGAPVLVTDSSLADRLPNVDGHVVLLDQISDSVAEYSCDNLGGQSTAENLAYVIYTSGSTGRPKGVAVEHRSLCNLIAAQRVGFDIRHDDRVLQFASISFDAAVSEIFVTLCNGATLCIAAKKSLVPGPDLIDTLRQHEITVATLPPTTLAAMEAASLPHLRTLISAGDRCSADLVGTWGVGRTFINAYGPTETTVCATLGVCHADGDRPAIGRPIANTKVYVLDHNRQPVPVGVPGELFVGGKCLARGYLNRPELTAERFVPNPFDDQPESRLYRTGDLVRWLNDGRLDFLGRVDEQVKVRGYRIEPGEIESQLRRSGFVQDAVVVAHDDGPQPKRLIAYVVPGERGSDDAKWNEASGEHVERWRSLYDQSRFDEDQATFNITGWNSSYSGDPIGAEAMKQWRDGRVARILAAKPDDVLEIGCGTGLLLFPVSEHCDSYVGTDFSQTSLDYVQSVLGQVSPRNVRLSCQTADDYAGLDNAAYDMVIINSVIQYFPDVEYLLQVLDGAIAATRPGGHVFIGDVRNLRLLNAFHADVQLFRADDADLVQQIHSNVQKQVSQEQELLIDPGFFAALRARWPHLDVNIQLQRGEQENELTRFRYDVMLQIGTQEQSEPAIDWIEWGDQQPGVSDIAQRLQQDEPQALGITGVPNRRIQRALAALDRISDTPADRLVTQLRVEIAAVLSDGLDPEEFWNLSNELPYRVRVNWSENDGRSFDVLFERDDVKSPAHFAMEMRQPAGFQGVDEFHRFANEPIKGLAAQKLVPDLRAALEASLPGYMIPSRFVVLQSLPLTPSGKVDRRLLPAPDAERPELERQFVAPRTELEQKLAEIWSAVVGVSGIGVNDNFFELGGHSLLATQMVARVHSEFGVQLPLWTLFDEPTIARQAKKIEELQSMGISDATATDDLPDLPDEIVIEPEVRIEIDARQLCGPTGNVFLTGATGFVGAHLLRELVHGTDRTVYCLGRGDHDTCRNRIRGVLSQYNLWDESIASKIVPVPGDLAEPLLGLDRDEFESLANSVDAIYHSGALVNFLLSYQHLKSANVSGTHEVIRLASIGRQKPLHYVSTIGVFPSLANPDDPICRENDPVDDWQKLEGGYAQTKWVAEKMVLEARARGLATNVYRLGRVTPHSEFGIWNESDLFYLLLQGILQFGVVPDVDARVDMIPADYVSRAIMQLSGDQAELGNIYHITHPHPISLQNLVKEIQALGVPLAVLPANLWREMIGSREGVANDDLFHNLLLFSESSASLPEDENDIGVEPVYDCQNTLAALAGSSVECPVIDQKLLQTYLTQIRNSLVAENA